MSDGHRDVRDLLPLWVAGRLEGADAARVEAALADDPELRLEAEVVRRLYESRPTSPQGLEARLRAVVEPRGWSASRRAWLSAAAAVAILGLGTLQVMRSGPEVALELGLDESSTPWVADDGRVAGATVLAELSEDDLMALIEELGG